ncbi:MAG TPA: glyoxylate/hydroxypyruvate reductase A [Rhizomicrobium sp.]|nr:glyoxylate/hydroxypyruvate reductase A [Rhizomicrobium sp.]
MSTRPNLLMVVPLTWAGLWLPFLSEANLNVFVHGRDDYKQDDIDYVLSFRPPPGFLKTLPKLKTVYSLGAGVDGFLADPDFPKQIPLVRFVDPQLSTEMAQYVVLHVLLQHRHAKAFEETQKQSKWAQMMLPRKTADTRIGVLGLGEIGTMAGERLRDLGFPVSGWSRSRKQVGGIKSYAGEDEFTAFMGASDFLICLLPLTDDTRGILNAKTFAMLPKDSYVINVARGGHLIEGHLIAALDSGHLAGATLDVFQTEPLPETSPLWKHPKIVVTPHVAAISDPRVAANFVIDGIAHAERGEKHPNTVDMSRGY